MSLITSEYPCSVVNSLEIVLDYAIKRSYETGECIVVYERGSQFIATPVEVDSDVPNNAKAVLFVGACFCDL
jgi:hypothetical protein